MDEIGRTQKYDGRMATDLLITTCLTLAAIHNVKGLVTLLAMRELIFNVKDANPDNQTTNIGYGSMNGFKSLFHRFAMAVISPESNEMIKH